MLKTDLLPYEADGREMVKVGVSFSKEEWNLNCWESYRFMLAKCARLSTISLF